MNENIAKLALGAALAEENISEMRIKAIVDKYPALSTSLTYKIGKDNSIVTKYDFNIYTSTELTNPMKEYLIENQDKNIQSVQNESKLSKIHLKIIMIPFKKNFSSKVHLKIAQIIKKEIITEAQQDILRSNLSYYFKMQTKFFQNVDLTSFDNITENINEIRKILKLEPINQVMSLKFLCAKEIAFSNDYNLINKTEKSLPEELLPYFSAIKSIADGQPTYLNALDDEINMVLSGLTDLFMIKSDVG